MESFLKRKNEQDPESSAAQPPKKAKTTVEPGSEGGEPSLSPLGLPVSQITRIQLGRESWADIVELPKDLVLSKAEFEELWDLKPQVRGKFKIFGKEVDIPRWQQVFGRPYYYSRTNHEAAPMHPLIEKYQKWCQQRTPTLNGALANWYLNGEEYIGPHSDDVTELLPYSEIYSISFGATREFLFEEKKGSKKKHRIPLPNGTLVIMGGKTQETHKHSVPKDKLVKTRRINLTFRSFKDAGGSKVPVKGATSAADTGDK